MATVTQPLHQPKTIACLAFGSVALTLLITGCWWPEKFDATLEVNSDKTYRFTYAGILAFAPAVAELRKSGKLDPAVEIDLKKAERKLLEEGQFTSCTYNGDGRYHVVFEKSGLLDHRVDLLGESLKVLSITPTAEGVEISGMSLDDSTRRQLREIGLGLDGTMRVVSGLQVTEHNAPTSPSLDGLVGCYEWHLTLETSNPPRLRLSNAPGTKPIMSLSTFRVFVAAIAIVMVVFAGLYFRRKA